MIITYSEVGLFQELNEEKVFTLIIENQNIFYNLIDDINNQIEGKNGEFVLSVNFQPQNIAKKVDLITQLVPFTVNQKNLVSKLYAFLKQKSVDENMYHKTQELLTFVKKYIYELTEDIESELISENSGDISVILKACDLKFDDSNLNLAEKLMEYMISVNEFKGETLFIIVNLRSYLNDKQTENFFKSVLLKKIRLICVENMEYQKLNYEDRVIIDKDICII